MLKIKQSVNLRSLCPQILLAVIVADQVYHENGHACIITSANDSLHMAGSKHYSGEAIDLSIKKTDGIQIGSDILNKMLADMKSRLNDSDFDIILEGDHFHIEYDPK